MGRIDKELALQMMLEGKGDRIIAEYFGTSRQAVNLLRRSLVTEGKLAAHSGVTKAAGQNSSSSLQTNVPTPGNSEAPQAAENNSHPEPSYEQITGWVVRVVAHAAEAAKLRQNLSDARAQLEDLQAQVRLLREQLERAKEDRASVMAKAAEYQQAIQQLRAAKGPLTPSPQDSRA